LWAWESGSTASVEQDIIRCANSLLINCVVCKAVEAIARRRVVEAIGIRTQNASGSTQIVPRQAIKTLLKDGLITIGINTRSIAEYKRREAANALTDSIVIVSAS
jgi:hypothetical protein